MTNTQMRYIILALALAMGIVSAQAQSQPANLIPAPAEYNVRPGTISRDKMNGSHEKLRISEKAMLRRLEGRKRPPCRGLSH